jgi:hypothetical protein
MIRSLARIRRVHQEISCYMQLRLFEELPTKAVSYVPRDCPVEAFDDLDGWSHEDYPSLIEAGKNKKSWRGRLTDCWLIPKIQAYVRNTYNGLCVLESTTPASWYKKFGYPRTIKSRGIHAFEVIGAYNDDSEHIWAALLQGECDVFNGFLTSLPPEIDLDNWVRQPELSRQETELLANRSTAFFVSIWDNEGCALFYF